LRGLAVAARAASLRWIVGRHIPTAKNGMVKEPHAKLGFEAYPIATEGAAGETAWLLNVAAYQASELPMTVERHQA
jgi:hypothetical protein